MGVPIPEHQPGDCCMWGSSRPSHPLFGNPRPRSQSLSPLSIRDITHLDVLEVTPPRKHFLYTVKPYLTKPSPNLAFFCS